MTREIVDRFSELNFLPMNSTQDDDTPSYANDDFASYNEGSSSIQECTSRPTVAIYARAKPAITRDPNKYHKMNAAQDDDTCSYSNDDFASYHEGSSSIHEIKSMPTVPINEKPTPSSAQSHDSSESEDSYSLDNDFAGSTEEDRSEDDHSCTHGMERSTYEERYTVVKELSPHTLETNLRQYRPGFNESRPDLVDAKGSSNEPMLPSEKKIELTCDAGYIGEVECANTTPTVAATLLPVLQATIQPASTNNPIQETPIAYPQQQCRVSFDPICVFIATKTPEGKRIDRDNFPKPKQYSTKRIYELSKPLAHNVYNTPDKSSDKAKKKSHKVSDEGPSFLDRMKMMEIEKREKLQRAAAEATYNARSDKVRYHLMRCVDRLLKLHCLLYLMSVCVSLLYASRTSAETVAPLNPTMK